MGHLSASRFRNCEAILSQLLSNRCVSYPIGISALGLLDRIVLGSSLGNGLSRLHGRTRKGRPKLLRLESATGETALALAGGQLGEHALEGLRGRD